MTVPEAGPVARRLARRLIVNADDFGRTEGINVGVIDAHVRGIVTSATLMVAYPAAAAAVRAARAHPDLGLGLHFALTGGRPLSDPESVPSLVDHEGRFPPKPDGMGATAADVATELAAQYERFHRLVGRPPTHLDSHHHSHRQPVVTEVVTRFARQHGVPVRNAAPAVRAELDRAGVATSDTFIEDFFAAGATVRTLLTAIAELAPGTTELMCHPAEVDDELRAGSSYVDDREREVLALCDPEVLAALHARNVFLVHFGAL